MNYGALVNDPDQTAKYWKIAVLYGEAHYRSEMEWVDKALAILEGKK